MRIILTGINKRQLLASVASVALLTGATAASAAEMNHEGHNGHSGHQHASAAQAGQHVHHSHGKGAWMVEYRFMRMEMDGLLDGTDSVSTEEISGATMPMGGGNMQKTAGKSYLMAPTEMTMDMHMVMLMYGLTDKVAIMGMLNYLKNDMDMIMHMTMEMNGNTSNVASNMQTSGVGDTQIGAMYQVEYGLVGSVMLSVPTGSIDEKVTMMGNKVQGGYPMQLGSGTYDLIPSITYNKKINGWTYGGQLEYTYHIGENDNDYTLGDRLELSAWAKYALDSSLNIAGRLDIIDWDKIDGKDPKIATMMSPTNDPDAQGGTRMDLTLDVSKRFGAHTAGLAYGVPIRQDLNGPQMEVKSMITLSYQYMMM